MPATTSGLRKWCHEGNWLAVFKQAFKNIDDVLWKEAGCTTEMDYTEQTSWLLFLKYLDASEQDKADEGQVANVETPSSIPKPHKFSTTLED